MEGIPDVDNFIGSTMTNLPLMCHFTYNHPSVLQDHVMALFRVCISNGCGWAPGPFLMLNACVTFLKPLDPFVDNLLRYDAVPIRH